MGPPARPGLRIELVTEETAELWREIHNAVIPASPLTSGEVLERLTRNRLTLAYAGGDLVGNATIRPPAPGTATVIVRVLPPFRRRGYGSAYLEVVCADALAMGATRLETVVLVANADGVAFAGRRGFVERERYAVGPGRDEYLTMALDPAALT